MSDLKERAEAFRVGLLAGYLMPDEVIAWADDLIATRDLSEPELIDVSLAVGSPVGELARALSAIRGEVSRPRLARLILSQMAVAVRRDATTGRAVAGQLEQMCIENLVPSSEARPKMGRLNDAFAIAESGTWGTLDEAQTDLVEFLSEWSVDPSE